VTVVAGIVVEASAFDIGRVLSATTARIDLTEFVPVDGRPVPYFWKEHGDDEAFERAVRADDRVASLTNLDGRSDASLYRVDWAGLVDGLVGALHDHHVLVEEGWTDDGERWRFRLRAPSQQALSAFQQACSDRGIRLDVRYVSRDPDDTPTAFGGLSAEQHEALVLALRNGYFDIPREHSQSELATMLGISRQSFGRRLRRAERNVFEALFWEELDG
jgi:hypothetical protein